MEGNRDDASRCIDIALKIISSGGDKKQALHYLTKAERLYPTTRAKKLIAKILSASGDTASTEEAEMPEFETTSPGAHGTEGKPRHRKGKDATTDVPKSSKEAATEVPLPETHSTYTPDQADAVKIIRKCKNYYEILGVAQDCNEEDLKKSYKKLAFKFHPDKNHAPGATEAFKAIGNAFAVLSDPSKRQRYDQYGSEEEQAAVSHQRSHTQYYEYDYTRGGFEGDISAEELFNIFFGGGFQAAATRGRPFHRTATRAQYQQRPQAQRNDESTSMLRLLPLLIFAVVMMLSNLLTEDPLYSLQNNSKYSTERKTSNLDVPYYVKPDFAQTYRGSVAKLESQVEEEFVSNLRSNCYRERMYRESLMWQARNTRNSRLYEDAQNTKMPSCDLLQEVYAPV